MDNSLSPPIVSVCIASYNYESYIGEAIESVVNQTFTEWEIIVVDDASPDNSPSVIQDWQSRYPDKITFIQSLENKGVCHSFNLGFKTARGKYIAILGSDDRMQPNRLDRQVQYLDANKDVGVACTLVNIIDSQGNISPGDSVFGKPIFDLLSQLLEGNFLNAPSAMIKREVFENAGFYNDALPHAQDFDHWLRILPSYQIKRIPERLTDYRIHGQNLSVKTEGAGKLPLAGAYETVISILRALSQQNTNLDSKKLPLQDVIAQKLYLAQMAKKTELNYLGKFNYSVSFVYCLLLDVVDLDENNQEANSLLKEVYVALGDEPRSIGEKPITVEEHKLIDTSGFNSLESVVVSAGAKTGVSIALLVKAVFDNKKEHFIDNLAKNTFTLNVAKLIFKRLKSDFEKRPDMALRMQHQQSLTDIKSILHMNPLSTNSKEVISFLGDVADWQKDREYKAWRVNHALVEIDAQLHAERLATWNVQPLFHMIMLMYDGQGPLLANTIDSLSQQLYGNWKLTVIGDGTAPDPLFDEVDVLDWVSFPDGADLYEFLNNFVSKAHGDWFVFMPAGTQLEPQAFLQIGDYINLYPSKQLFYVDDDFVDEQGEFHQPRFKPDFNIDLLRSLDYAGVVTISSVLFEAVSGFDGLPGYENLGLTFKAYENLGVDGVGHIQDILIHLPENVYTQTRSQIILKQAVHNHLLRSGVSAYVSDGIIEDTCRVEYFHETKPKVSIIVPTKDKLEFLRPCLESVFAKTDYPNFEVIVVNNQSVSNDTLTYFEQIQQRYPNIVHVMDYPHDFNYAAISNSAVEKSSGEYLLFLNNDTEVIQEHWLDRMMAHAQRSDVGVVGCRLVYPEIGLIQHAGVLLGLDSAAEHHYLGQLNIQESGYMGRAQVDQNYSAVTGACLLIEKSVYQSVSGMDEENFAVAYNDIDLCLKVGALGLNIVWTPYVTLIHHGSITQSSESKNREKSSKRIKGFEKERTHIIKKWLPQIANDPAYNKHLSLAWRDMRIEADMPSNWDVNFHDRPRVFGLPLSGGSGDYRVTQPFEALSFAALAQCEYFRLSRTQGAAHFIK